MSEDSTLPMTTKAAERECDVCGRKGVRAFKVLPGPIGSYTVCTDKRACVRRDAVRKSRDPFFTEYNDDV